MDQPEDKATRELPAMRAMGEQRTAKIVVPAGATRSTGAGGSDGDGAGARGDEPGASREPNLAGMTILLADDDYSVRDLVARVLTVQGFVVTSVSTVETAIDELERQPFDVVIVDKNLPDGTGFEILQWISEHGSDCASLLMTAYANVDSVVQAMRLGARDYLVKPFEDVEIVRQSIRRVARTLALERKNAQLHTALQATNQALASLAVRDPLTKLFNHAYLQDVVEREVARCQRYNLQFSLLLVDLDAFRAMNDEHGHAAGDRVLREFADLLMSRSPVGGGVPFRSQDITARYGHDRFAVLLPETPKGAAVSKAESLRRTVSGFDFAARGLPAQAVSVGVSTFPDDASERAGVIQCAEIALLAAKQGGRDRVVGYSSSLANLIDDDEEMAQRARRLHALDRSIAELAFDYVYQPIAGTDDGSIFGYEALVRPRDPALGDPQTLLFTAESAGKLGELGRALRQCALGALRCLPEHALLFINLHPLELYDPAFASIERLLAGWADRIVLELTEFASVGEYEPLRQVISWLRGLGIRIALDDLGSGYSGLNTLAMIEPDFVKLDMQLVRRARHDARTRRLVRYIVEFAQEENIAVIAEGVERADERDMVTELGCHYVQGFLIGVGLSLDAIRAQQAERAREIGDARDE